MSGRIFVIGASTGGIEALCRLVHELPMDFPAAILIALHVAADSPRVLPVMLTKAGPLTAVYPRDRDPIEPGRIYVAPPNLHLLVEQGRMRLSHGPRENFVRPAIDPLFRSAAMAYGAAVVGVVLTGRLDDGTAGLLAIKDRAGTTIVQDPAEAQAPSMPRSALKRVAIDHCLGLAAIAVLLAELARDDPPESADPTSSRRLMEIEHRIASGSLSAEDWSALEKVSAPSGLNCPDCRSALYEIKEQRLLRFRCRSGHAYAAQGLLAAQAGAWENQLSTLFGLAMEETALAKRMLTMQGYEEDPAVVAELRARIESREREGAQVAGWLQGRRS